MCVCVFALTSIPKVTSVVIRPALYLCQTVLSDRRYLGSRLQYLKLSNRCTLKLQIYWTEYLRLNHKLKSPRCEKAELIWLRMTFLCICSKIQFNLLRSNLQQLKETKEAETFQVSSQHSCLWQPIHKLAFFYLADNGSLTYLWTDTDNESDLNQRFLFPTTAILHS